MKRRQSFPIIAVTERSQILTIPRTQGATISYWSRRQRAPISIEKGKQHLVGEIGKRGQLRMWKNHKGLKQHHVLREFPVFQKPEVIRDRPGEVDRARSPREVCARHGRLPVILVCHSHRSPKNIRISPHGHSHRTVSISLI